MLQFLLTTDAGTNNPGSSYWLIGLVVLMIAVLVYSNYSNRKRRKQAEEANSRLAVGSRIKTIGGIVGTIKEIDEFNGNFVIESGNTTFVIDSKAVYSLELFGARPGVADVSVSDTETADALETADAELAEDADILDAADAQYAPSEETEPAPEVQPEPPVKDGEVGH